MIRTMLLIFMSLLLLNSCDTNTIAGDLQSMQSERWPASQKVNFEFPKLDSIQQFDVYLNIRNTNAYPFSNIFLIAELEYPFGKIKVDTLEYKMANPDGTWLGTGIGSIKESKLTYLENFSFDESGTYKLSVSQAVRNNGDTQGVSQLEGITDVGFTIEKTTNK